MATDIMQYVVLGVVVIGGIYIYTHLGDITAAFQQGAMGQPGGGGGGAGGAGGIGGTPSVDCMLNPTDPSCMLSSSADLLGAGTNSNSTILKDLNTYYNAQCVKANGCGPLDTTKLKKAGLQHVYQDSFRQAGMYRRGSASYDQSINALVKVIAQDSCTACYNAYGGAGTPVMGGCKPASMLTEAQFSGNCATVCDAGCTAGYTTCFLGHDNSGNRRSFCQCGPGNCADLRNKWTAQLPSGGGGPMKSGPVNSNCDYYSSSGNYCWHEVGNTKQLSCAKGSCSAARTKYLAAFGPGGTCQSVMYNGVLHCVGDPCGSGGQIMSNGNCSVSNSGGHGGTPKPPRMTPTFTCPSNTGSCFAASATQTCVHICDKGKQKNCVRCSMIGGGGSGTGCAAARAGISLGC